MTSIKEPKKHVPALAICATTGLGKSHIFRKVAAENIRRLRAAGDKRSIVVFVPTHDLALEQAMKFNQLHPDLTAKRFIGIDNKNLDKPKTKMCERVDIVLRLLKHGSSLSSICCTREVDYCPHHYESKKNPCGYSFQSQAFADIWFMPHQYLFLPMPNNINVALIGIDESFWQASINDEVISLELENLINTPIYKSALASNNQYADISKSVYEAIKSMTGTTHIDTAKIYDALDGEAARLCWAAYNHSRNSMVIPAVSASMNTEQLISVLRTVDNSLLKNLCAFWLTLSKAIKIGGVTPYITKSQINEVNAKSGVILNFYKLPNIHNSWIKPTVILDATMPVEINKLFYPQLDLREFHLPPKNTTITQIIDKTLSKKMMVPGPSKSKKKNAELERNLNRLRSACLVLASRFNSGVKIKGRADPVKVLLVTTKDIEENLTVIGLPSYIATLHFKALSGLDMYKEIPCMIVASRLELAPNIAEHQASLLTGSLVKSCLTTDSKWYPKNHKQIEVKEGICALASSSFHPDTITEEVRSSWCESELLQAIGRARAVRRTARNPLELFILTDIPLPITVDQVTVWNDVVPVELEIILGSSGAVPLAYNELMRTNPNTIITKRKARTAVNHFKERYPELNQGVVSPIYSTNRQNDTQFRFFKSLLLIQYTRAVKGSKPCKAVIHDHPNVSWRTALHSITGEVKNITFLSHTANNSKLNVSSRIEVKVKNLRPVGIAASGLLTKPRLNLT